MRGNPAGATEAIYEYDPFGRRLSSSLRGAGGDEAISYLYDGDQIIEAYPCSLLSAPCSLSQSFLSGPGIDEPLELIQHPSLTTYYYHQDGLGSITQLTNSAGTTQESYTYSPYGIPSTTSTLGNPFLFTGREYDSETELYYYRTRYYHATLGRFLQRDPIGYVSGNNLYHYASNNSINFIDPEGLTVIRILDSGGILVTPGSSGGGVTHVTPIDQPISIPFVHPPTPIGPTIIRDPISQPGATVSPKIPKPVQVIILAGGIVIGQIVGGKPIGVKWQDVVKPPGIEIVIPGKGKRGEKGAGTDGDGKDDGKERFDTGPRERDPKKQKK